MTVDRLADSRAPSSTDVEAPLADPELLADQQRYVGLTRAHKELDAIVGAGRACGSARTTSSPPGSC